MHALGIRFNYVVAPEIYYTQALGWSFNVTFCITISTFYSRTDGSNNLYSTLLTRSEFWVPARGIAYTNITHNVTPLSLCKYTLFSKSEDHLFATSALSFDKNNHYTPHTLSRSAIIFQAEKAATISYFNFKILLPKLP